MKIIIAGQGKSGTTALFYKLKEVMPTTSRYLFEPTTYNDEAEKSTLAKALIDPPGRVNFDTFHIFQKKILIIRDPRDNLVSRILYRIYNNKGYCINKKENQKFLSILRKKEKNPCSVSVIEIINTFDEFQKKSSLDNLCLHPTTGINFHNAHKEYFVVKYEDFVNGATRKLSEYIGLQLNDYPASVDQEHLRVARSKGFGSWRNWFLQSDVDFFKPIFLPYLEHFNYTIDWETSKNQKIDPNESSRYVEGLIKERLMDVGKS